MKKLFKGTGELIKLQFICRICALINDEYAMTLRDERYSYIRDLHDWWKAPGTCLDRGQTWKETEKENS